MIKRWMGRPFSFIPSSSFLRSSSLVEEKPSFPIISLYFRILHWQLKETPNTRNPTIWIREFDEWWRHVIPLSSFPIPSSFALTVIPERMDGIKWEWKEGKDEDVDKETDKGEEWLREAHHFPSNSFSLRHYNSPMNEEPVHEHLGSSSILANTWQRKSRYKWKAVNSIPCPPNSLVFSR